MNRNKWRGLALCTLLTILLTACASSTVTVTNSATGLEEEVYLAENDAITDGDKAAVEEILSAFEGALASTDAAPLMQYVDESFTATEENLETFFKSISEGGTFTAYDWYYVRNLEDSLVPVLIQKTAASQEAIRVVPASRDLYVALYSAGEGTPTETMLSLMCAKKGGKWSLVWIDITDFRYHGEDANALYAKAKAAYENGEVMSAFLYAQMTANIAVPANLLRYPNSDAISEFVYQVAGEGLKDYPLPMELEVDGVTLRSVATAKTEDGVVPMFFYSTETPLANEKALAREAKKVYNAIEEIFPGTIEKFPTAEFRMTNADPEADENFDFETVIITMN